MNSRLALVAATTPFFFAGAAFAVDGSSDPHVTYPTSGKIGAVIMNPYKIAPLTAVIRNGGYVLTDITARIVPKEGGQGIKYKVSDAQARTAVFPCSAFTVATATPLR